MGILFPFLFSKAWRFKLINLAFPQPHYDSETNYATLPNLSCAFAACRVPLSPLPKLMLRWGRVEQAKNKPAYFYQRSWSCQRAFLCFFPSLSSCEYIISLWEQRRTAEALISCFYETGVNMYKSDNQWLLSAMDKTIRTSLNKNSCESWPESYDWEKKQEVKKLAAWKSQDVFQYTNHTALFTEI